MRRSDKRHLAILVTAELSFLVIGGVGLTWLGADIIVRALRMTLLGDWV
jgi:hypothetical protein